MDVFAPRYSNEAAARAHLESVRWPDGPFCPHCGSYRATRLEGKAHRKGLVQCNEPECREQYTVTVGTVFERSKVPLHKWLFVNHLLVSSKKGISAHQIHRMIGVTYKTAWFMCHRIRTAMDQNDGPLGGDPSKVVEADETYVGGSTMNRLSKKTAPKKIMFTLVERGGPARSFHVANVHANTLRPLLFQNADRLSTLMTDENTSYTKAGEHFWQHKTVNHRSLEYARGNWHTNTAENFFSIFKRGIVGTYHHLSEAHLHRYCREFDFRYNHRDVTDGERADQSLRGIFGKRLTYRRPHAIAA
jgi:transposase-like protein